MELLNLPSIKVATLVTGKGTLERRVLASDVFVIYGTNVYYDGILLGDEEVCTPIRLSIELGRTVILLLDKKLPMSRMVNMRTIKGVNVIKEIIYDFNDNVEKKKQNKRLPEYVKR